MLWGRLRLPSCVAMVDAIRHLQRCGDIASEPLQHLVAAVSVGIYQGQPVLDLDYAEDSTAETDMNVVMDENGGIIEVQGTAEGATFSRDEMDSMMALAEKGILELIQSQRDALSGD